VTWANAELASDFGDTFEMLLCATYVSLCLLRRLSAFPLRSPRLCGEDWGAHIFEPQRHREHRGSTEIQIRTIDLSTLSTLLIKWL